jgi:sn-glycerol 3-phosphate transport system substrate-binding protein
LPCCRRAKRGSPTGGANFHIFTTATKDERAASLLFIKWVTSPERAAQWGIDTGYVATRPDAWYTPEVREYVAKFRPAAVARDQLPHAVPELSTHDNQQVTLPLNSALQAALAGRKTPKAALAEAQAMRTGRFGHFGGHEAGNASGVAADPAGGRATGAAWIW